MIQPRQHAIWFNEIYLKNGSYKMPIIRRPIIAGNWKMNGLRADSLERAKKLAERLSELSDPLFDLLICPPTTMLGTIAAAIEQSDIHIGGQDCHSFPSGPHTGDISPNMLLNIG